MNKTFLMTVVGCGILLFGHNVTAQAGHGCGYGGGYVYSAPVYAAPVYSYAPSYSYGPSYQSAYVQPSYGYSSGISIGFGGGGYGGGYYRGNGGHYGGYRGNHYGGHHGDGHYGGGHYGGGHHHGHH